MSCAAATRPPDPPAGGCRGCVGCGEGTPNRRELESKATLEVNNPSCGSLYSVPVAPEKAKRKNRTSPACILKTTELTGKPCVAAMPQRLDKIAVFGLFDSIRDRLSSVIYDRGCIFCYRTLSRFLCMIKECVDVIISLDVATQKELRTIVARY